MSTASLTGLETATTQSLAITSSGTTVQILVNNFLTTVTEANWNLMVAAFQSDSYATSLGNSTPYNTTAAGQVIRTLVTVADGTVAYDSSKGTAGNTWAKFGTKSINSDNHNTRPEIMLAILSSSGTGVANRYSTSVSKVDMNLATRFGLSTNYPLGCYRLSQSLA